MPQDVAAKLTGVRKAAILMVLMGEKAATTTLRQLPPKQVERLMREVAGLGEVDPATAQEVLREYMQMLVTGNQRTEGNSAYVEKLLVEAFGEVAAKNLFERAMSLHPSSDLDPTDPNILEKAEPQQLAKLLESESPQTVALVVAHVGSGLASRVLSLLPEKLKMQAIERMARMRTFSPEVVERTLTTLRKKLATAGHQQQVNFGGASVVAKLLKSMDAGSAKTILDSINESDPELVTDIRGMMFTFEDLKDIPETGLRELLSQADKKILSLALKGAAADIQEHIFKCMSSRAVEMLKEDMEALGPVRMRDVTQAQQEITRLAQTLEEEGKLTRKSADGNDSIV